MDEFLTNPYIMAGFGLGAATILIFSIGVRWFFLTKSKMERERPDWSSPSRWPPPPDPEVGRYHDRVDSLAHEIAVLRRERPTPPRGMSAPVRSEGLQTDLDRFTEASAKEFYEKHPELVKKKPKPSNYPLNEVRTIRFSKKETQ